MKNANNTKPMITATPPIVPPAIAPIGVDEGGEEDAGVVVTIDEDEDVGVDVVEVVGVVEVVEVVVEILRLAGE
jgi:hypothetical protein